MPKTPEPEVDIEALAAAQLAAIRPILTPEEIEAAKGEARKAVTAKAKKAAIDAVIKEETALLNAKTGEGYKDEMVWINIDLPDFCDRLTVDGVSHMHGHLYHRPRHYANSLREQMARAWEHEADIKGESMRQRLGKYRTEHFADIQGTRIGVAA